jgi:thymidylate kinase
MILIIEGPDGSGKTTLANKLSKQTGYPVIHRVQPKTEEDKKRMMEEYLHILQSGKNAIFDRCWYSEMAYGPIMRDESVITYPQMYALEDQLAKRGGLIIYCTDKPDVLWRCATKRGEDYITDYSTFVAICEAFDEIMNVPHKVPVVRYGYQNL